MGIDLNIYIYIYIYKRIYQPKRILKKKKSELTMYVFQQMVEW